MKRFKWKWIFTRSKTCCTIWRPFQFAMVAILNPKWPPKYKNPPIWQNLLSKKQPLFLRIDNRFWNWEPYYDPSDHIISCYYSSSFFLSFFLLSKVCLTHFSEMPRSNFMKPCRNIICHVKLCLSWLIFFQNGCRCHGNGQNAKKNEKHKNDHSRLLAKQKLTNLDRNNIHIQWNEISQKIRNRLDKFCRSCHGNKKGGFKFFLDFFDQTS